MPGKAVFLDRDKTLIEDPGYISDPAAVRLLPGADLALKSLRQAGYKIFVVTNQSGVARGLLTEQALDEIHAELRRQLGDKGVHLDGIYYCPFHPEGTVEEYARESDLRKPQPGMLLKAAEEHDVDLAASWMIGDSSRDIEAGQRAGCRTVRLRTPEPAEHAGSSENHDENATADFTVRNLVDAARMILRESDRPASSPPAAPAAMAAPVAPTAPTSSQESPAPAGHMTDAQVRQEILRYVRQFVHDRRTEEFSLTKLLAGIAQMLAVVALVLGFLRMLQSEPAMPVATFWVLVAAVLQIMALTLFMMQRPR